MRLFGREFILLYEMSSDVSPLALATKLSVRCVILLDLAFILVKCFWPKNIFASRNRIEFVDTISQFVVGGNDAGRYFRFEFEQSAICTRSM